MRATCNLSNEDYGQLRRASMNNKFSYEFTRKESGDVTFEFKKFEIGTFCKKLSTVIDFGATSAAEVFGFEDYLF